jgi:hypothetical protein
MEIKTKFDIGDILFYFKDSSICSNPVTDIDIKVYYSGGIGTYYSLGLRNCYQTDRMEESRLFKTKKALINSLSK